jgi:uncharacterized protein YjdB
LITAKSAGTADITVAATDGSGKSATCHVTVIVPVTEIRLNKSSNTLYIGETETLAATIVPSNATNQTLRWTSNNTVVADVTDGLVTAKSAGTADITVAATDGSGKSATYRITVIAHVSGVSLNKTSNTLFTGETETLTATVSPANATNRAISWTSSDPSVAEVVNGVITARSEGTAEITVTAANGKTNVCSVTVVAAQDHTGILQAQQPAVRVYLDRQLLHVDSPASEQISVYTVGGALLYRQDKPAGETVLTVNLPKGILIVRGSSGWSRKLII